MVTLVLAIDRDNDLGRKTGIRSPVIGREANVQAALKLGLADPEESDTNTMLAAIRSYDMLVSDGIEAEVVTICGDLPVGTKSDMKISAALDRVIRETGATRAIMVSDGAEDRELEPIIRSRLRIDSTRLVVVQQSRPIENAFYTLIHKLEDPKIQRKFVVPLALAALVFGLAHMLNYASIANGAIFVTIGLYLLIKVAGWEDELRQFYNDALTGTSERVSLFTIIMSGILLLVGAAKGIEAMDKASEDGMVGQVLAFTSSSGILGWLIAALIILEFGRVADAFLRDGILNIGFVRFTSTMIAMGFIISGAIEIIRVIAGIQGWDANYLWHLLVGISVGIVGFLIHDYLREQRERNAASTEDWL